MSRKKNLISTNTCTFTIAKIGCNKSPSLEKRKAFSRIYMYPAGPNSVMVRVSAFGAGGRVFDSGPRHT